MFLTLFLFLFCKKSPRPEKEILHPNILRLSRKNTLRFCVLSFNISDITLTAQFMLVASGELLQLIYFYFFILNILTVINLLQFLLSFLFWPS